MLKGFTTLARTAQKAGSSAVDVITVGEKCLASTAARVILPVSIRIATILLLFNID